MVNRQNGFISGSLLVLMFVLIGVSVTLLSLVNLSSERSLADINNIKAELIFEEFIINLTSNSIIKDSLINDLPYGYDIKYIKTIQNNSEGYRLSLKKGLDIKGEVWLKTME